MNSMQGQKHKNNFNFIFLYNGDLHIYSINMFG